MTFAEALVRIEELLTLDRGASVDEVREVRGLLSQHADSIVQLAKVAERLHEFILYTQCYDNCVDDYNSLMKGE